MLSAPSVTAWVREIGLDESLLSQPGLSALQTIQIIFINERLVGPNAPIPPDSVMRVWQSELAGALLMSAQLELKFIAQARRCGWSEDRIAAALGLTGPEAIGPRAEQLTGIVQDREAHRRRVVAGTDADSE